MPEQKIVTSLEVLAEPFRGKVRGLLADAMERRTYFVVTETIRTYERQKELFEEGKSRTMRSNHLIGKAVDLAPVAVYADSLVQEVTWDREHRAWAVLKDLAEKWGLVWGGLWKDFPDFPHLEAHQ